MVRIPGRSLSKPPRRRATHPRATYATTSGRWAQQLLSRIALGGIQCLFTEIYFYPTACLV